MLLNYDSTPKKNQIFENDINYELAEIAYYQKLIEEKQLHVQKLEAAQDKANIALELVEEITAALRDTDDRYLGFFRAALEEIMLKSPDPFISQPLDSEETLPSPEEQQNVSDDDDNNNGNGGVKRNLSPHPSDNGGNAAEAEKTETIAAESTTTEQTNTHPTSEQLPPINISNQYVHWKETENPCLGYFIRRNNNTFQTGYISTSSKSRLNSWKTTLKKLFPSMGFELRKAKRFPWKWELKIWGITADEFESLASFNFFKSPKDPENALILKTFNSKKIVEIDESQLPIGCFIQRTEDWAALEYYVYVYQKTCDLAKQALRERNYNTSIIDTKQIGRLVQYLDRITAWNDTTSKTSNFHNTTDAINYLLQNNGITREEIASAYQEKYSTEEDIAPYGICPECGTPKDIPPNHCPKCGWLPEEGAENLPEQKDLVAATAPN